MLYNPQKLHLFDTFSCLILIFLSTLETSCRILKLTNQLYKRFGVTPHFSTDLNLLKNIQILKKGKY